MVTNMGAKMQHLTYIDRAIIAHDFLNPNIPDNYRAVPVAMMADDARDYRVMRDLESGGPAKFEGYDAEGLARYSNVALS